MPFVPDPKIDARFPYDLECLLCEKVAEDVMPESLNGVTNHLVRMQEHLMAAHGADQTEFARHTQRKVQKVVTKEWTWYFVRPDGTEWLKATMRKRYLNQNNPVVAVLFEFQNGPLMVWKLERPWEQEDAFAEVGRLGAQYALGIDLELPETLKDPVAIERAHDCLWAWVMDEAPARLLGADTRRATHASLDVLCWILGHDHNIAFADNLEKLGWRDLVMPTEEGDGDAQSS